MPRAKRKLSRNRKPQGRENAVDRGLASSFLIEGLEDRTLLATFVPGELLVQFDRNVDVASRADARAQVSGQLLETVHTSAMQHAGQGVLERISLGQGVTVDAAIQRFRALRGVAYAEPNWVYTHNDVSNDTHYLNGNMWGVYSDDSPVNVGPVGTTNAFGSQAEQAWNNGFTGSSSVYIGVIDEGVDFNHPDLAPNMWLNPFDPVDGVDNDGNGRIDDTRGWDFFNNDSSVYDGTDDDHGTHVAGTIGAKGGNATGVAGINWNVTLISTKFLGPSGGSTLGAIQSLDYLTDLKTRHGLNIVATNNSWGGGGFSQGLLDAITRAANQGILFVAAAGNSNSNNDVSGFYPSNYDTTAGAGYDAVIAVASITNTGAKSSFSSYGATTVDLGAPGSSIASTLPANSYGLYSGTSMATPHVTGAIGLYASTHAGASAASMRAALLANVTATSSLAGITVTGGRLDVDKLMGGVSVPSLSIGDVSVTEGNSGITLATFTVTLSATSASTVTVNYATADGTATAGSDYGAGSGTLTFTPGTTTQSFSVQVFGDTTVESNETFTVNLSSPSNGTIGDGSGLGTIVNDDAALPTLSVGDVSQAEGNSGSSFMSFTVTLSAASASTVTVNYATSNGSAIAGTDYTGGSGTLTFAPGTLTQTFTVQIFGDTTVEPNETFNITLSSPINATIADGSGLGTIINDDASAGTISINDVSGPESAGNFVFTVTLSSPSTGTVTVNYATANGTARGGNGRNSDYRHQNGTLTFLAGETAKTISVRINDDVNVEPNETFYVNLSGSAGAAISDNQGIGTIVNDDSGGFGLRAEGYSASTSGVSYRQEALPTSTRRILTLGATKALEVLAEVESKANSAALPGLERAQAAIEAIISSEPETWRVIAS